MPTIFRAIVPLLAALTLLTAGRAAAEDRVVLQTRPGVTQPILFLPAASPVASVVLFPGGVGVIANEPGNFLLRVRGEFAAQGISVAAIDVPSDHAIAAIDFRASADHAQDVAAVIAFLKQKAAVPVWLVGTSNGSISAANAAVRLGPSQASGLVLTSSVWTGGMGRVSLDKVAVPTLVVHNRQDACRKSSPDDAEPGLRQLTAAPAKELVFVSGGIPKGNPCGGASAHGYYGIENQVVPVIVAWIKRHGPAAR